MFDRILGNPSSSSSSPGAAPPRPTDTEAGPSRAPGDETQGPPRRSRPALVRADAETDASLRQRLLPQAPRQPAPAATRTANWGAGIGALRSWFSLGPPDLPSQAFRAACGGDTKELQRLLEQTPSLAIAVSDKQDTLVTWSAWLNQERSVQAVLHHAKLTAPDQFAAYINHRDSWGRTALGHAAAQCRPALAKLLLQYDETKINIPDDEGRTPLHHAVRQDSMELVELLLAKTDIELNIADHEGRTPLHHAVRQGSMELVKLLLAQTGIELNIADHEGRRPLHHAVRQGNLELAELLLAQAGIEPSLPDHAGDTPLHLAIREDHEALAVRLAAHPAALPDQPNLAHATPLTTAITHVRPELVNILLENDQVDPNRPGPDGLRPIWQVLRRWNEFPLYRSDRLSISGQMLCSFVASGRVDSNCLGLAGETPLTYICKQQPRWDLAEPRLHVMWQATTLQALLEAGRCEGSRLDPAARNRAGKTALQVAQAHGNATLASILIEDQERRRRLAPADRPRTADQGA
jgi:ankyrin repeat protein